MLCVSRCTEMGFFSFFSPLFAKLKEYNHYYILQVSNVIQLNLGWATILCARKSGLLQEVVSHGRYSTVIKGHDRPTQTPDPCLCMPSCHHQKPCLSLEFMLTCIE